MTGAVSDDPRPIDAEYELAGETAEAGSKRGLPQPMRSKSIGLSELLIASASASVLGAVMAIVVTSANSGAETGTLAREIDALNRSHDDLAIKTDQAGADVVAIRARLDAQAERLDRQNADEMALRSEIAAVAGQVSALSGAGPGTGAPIEGAVASNSPLGVLLSRLNRVENVIADDASAPQTTRQMQRAIEDLTAKSDTLAEANATLADALDKRQQALAALEAGLKSVSDDMDVVRGRVVQDQRLGEALGIVQRSATIAAMGPAPVKAAEESRTIRALSSLETAAQRGGTFLPQQQVLASLLPQDDQVADLAILAARGAPALDELKHDFSDAARNALRISAERSDDGWNWLRPEAAERMRGPVNSTTDIIAEARRSLDAGDARGAVEAINAMSGPPARAFGKWRSAALRRAELDERLETLNRRLVGASAEPLRVGQDS